MLHQQNYVYVCIIYSNFYISSNFNNNFLQVIGDSSGIDKWTVSRVVRDVAHALNRRRHQFIKWPSNDQADINKNNFFLQAAFPCVIGWIDCTHIKIQAPYDNENYYVNRKRYHSINVRGICDHEGTCRIVDEKPFAQRARMCHSLIPVPKLQFITSKLCLACF